MTALLQHFFIQNFSSYHFYTGYQNIISVQLMLKNFANNNRKLKKTLNNF